MAELARTEIRLQIISLWPSERGLKDQINNFESIHSVRLSMMVVLSLACMPNRFWPCVRDIWVRSQSEYHGYALVSIDRLHSMSDISTELNSVLHSLCIQSQFPLISGNVPLQWVGFGQAHCAHQLTMPQKFHDWNRFRSCYIYPNKVIWYWIGNHQEWKITTDMN